MTEVWFYFVLLVVYTGGWYFKGRFDGAEAVRQQNRTLNESRKRP